jgi:hypothetical protein
MTTQMTANSHCRRPRYKCLVGLLFLLLITKPASAEDAHHVRTVNIKNERKPFSGMISSLFGGIIDRFQGEAVAASADKAENSGGSAARELAGDPKAIFINAGGPEYVDGNDITWETDDAYTSDGRTYSTSRDISNTDNPTIYQSERFGSSLSYNVPVTNGIKYDVFLHFAEIYNKAFYEGARIFDVFVEGDLVADNFDIFKAAKGGYKAYVLGKEDVVVNDGLLTIELIRVKQVSLKRMPL